MNAYIKTQCSGAQPGIFHSREFSRNKDTLINISPVTHQSEAQ